MIPRGGEIKITSYSSSYIQYLQGILACPKIVVIVHSDLDYC